MNEVPIRVPAQFAAIHTHLIVQTLVLQAFGFDAFVAQPALIERLIGSADGGRRIRPSGRRETRPPCRSHSLLSNAYENPQEIFWQLLFSVNTAQTCVNSICLFLCFIRLFSEHGIVVIWQERDFPVPDAPPDRSANWAVKPE